MLKTITSNSPSLLAFVATLQIKLSKPQNQHVLNVVDGLVVDTLSTHCTLMQLVYGKRTSVYSWHSMARNGTVSGH